MRKLTKLNYVERNTPLLKCKIQVGFEKFKDNESVDSYPYVYQ